LGGTISFEEVVENAPVDLECQATPDPSAVLVSWFAVGRFNECNETNWHGVWIQQSQWKAILCLIWSKTI